jgi:hypothetical protein
MVAVEESSAEIEMVNGRTDRILESAVVKKVDSIAPTSARKDIMREVSVVVNEKLIVFTNGLRALIRGLPGVVPEVMAATKEHFLRTPG